MKGFKIAVIFLGRPGAGKDTQAEFLAKKFRLLHLSSSRLIRDALKNRAKKLKLGGRTYDVSEERRLQKSGFLTTPSFAAALLKSKIRSAARSGRGIVMSGSPRTLLELGAEFPLLKNLYGRENVSFFYLKVSPSEALRRILKRHRRDLKKLDTREVIKKRQEVFRRETYPVIKRLKRRKLIVEINGGRSIKTVHKNIVNKIAG